MDLHSYNLTDLDLHHPVILRRIRAQFSIVMMKERLEQMLLAKVSQLNQV
jgi:hypothetical protein